VRVFASSISSRSDNHERSDGFEAKVLIDGEEQQLRELEGRPRDPAPFPAYAQPDEFFAASDSASEARRFSRSGGTRLAASKSSTTTRAIGSERCAPRRATIPFE
jgi:hypothetical protein